MRVNKSVVSIALIICFVLASLILLLGRILNQSTSMEFNLEVTINGLDSTRESHWVLGSFDPIQGFLNINFETGCLDVNKSSKLKFQGEKLIISGKISRPKLYRLKDELNNLQLVFVLGFGDQKIKTDISYLKEYKDVFEPVYFEYKGNDFNKELFEYWSDSLINDYRLALENYNSWKNKKMIKIFGIGLEDYKNLKKQNIKAKIFRKENINKDEELQFINENQKKRSHLNSLRCKFAIDYLKKNPNSYIAYDYVLIYVYMLGLHHDYESLEKYVPYIGKKLHQTSSYKMLHAKFNEQKKLQTNSPAPDFLGVDINGDRFRLSDLRGNYVLVEFGESSCELCEAEQSNLMDLYLKYLEKDFEILSLSLDNDKQNWINYLKNGEKPWIQIWDSTGYEKSSVIKDYLNPGLPFYFIVDKDGNLIGKKLRGTQFAGDKTYNINVLLDSILNP